MPRYRVHLSIALACATAIAVAGCRNSAQVFKSQDDGGWFSKPVDVFAKPDWARPAPSAVNLGPQGPVGPEDMVNTDGQCAAPATPLAQAPEPSPAATEPATPASATPNSGQQKLEPAAAPPVMGGIALGMTECQAIQRAGSPSNVAISAGEKGERKVVLTFLSGPWPGIYTFSSGRLNLVERAPEQPKPAKAAPKSKKKPSANTAQRTSAQ